ncbi:mitochondrial sodium/calcium exchanger protein-like [Uloborus diversus]|uniref:mitochondrial sodium/calcium exchanger protein-like n=1 Tax=Uloborus diversus TaxID=327109 RepID=UPI002409CF63|nr:mitochondrial sodium/calcium exchanger protein-like [Uloborus diversus]
MSDTECVAIHESTEKCSFYLNTPSCKDSDGKLDYMYFIFCHLDPDRSWIGIAVCIIWILILFVGLGVTADDFLCPSLVVITKTLRLSQNIAGVTFLAFGNGAPDIFSSVAGIEQERPELVIGTLFGAGIFVTSVVAGSIIVAKPFKIMERPFLRDIIFYVCAAFWAFLRFYYEEVSLWHSIAFIALYILYILVVIISRIIYNRYQLKNKPKIPEIEIESPEPEAKRSPSVAFKPTGIEDDPEAAGVVLRRFSFRGSISGVSSKRRISSSHSHHEHVIKTLTQSVDSHPNPVYKNGHTLPPPLDSQISKTSLSSLLSRTGEQTILREFLLLVSPIDIEAWSERGWLSKIFEIAKAPVCFLLIITVPVVDYENDKNNWCRPLNIIHCFTAPMFVIIALGEYDNNVRGFPAWAIVLLVCLALASAVFFTSSNDEPPAYHFAFGYIGFVASVMWVYLIASEIVSLLKTIGIIFKLSDAILGLTVLAWGNSIGDFISNLSVARQGYPRMGISACYGGPLLNLLLGIGIPYTIMIVKKGRPLELKYDRLITLLYGTLSAVLLSTIVTMTALRFNAKRQFGIFLICMYVTFITVAVIFETGVI